MTNEEALAIWIRIGGAMLMGALVGVCWWGLKEVVRWMRR